MLVAAQLLASERAALLAAGLSCDVVSGGGTGTLDLGVDAGVLDEIQAGSYVLMDASYLRLGLPFERALTCRATVISRHGDRAVLDAGLKALSAEYGMPRALRTGLTITRLADEHATAELADPADPLAVGDAVLLVPGHVDPTVNLHVLCTSSTATATSRSGRSTADSGRLSDIPMKPHRVYRKSGTVRPWPLPLSSPLPVAPAYEPLRRTPLPLGEAAPAERRADRRRRRSCASCTTAAARPCCSSARPDGRPRRSTPSRSSVPATRSSATTLASPTSRAWPPTRSPVLNAVGAGSAHVVGDAAVVPARRRGPRRPCPLRDARRRPIDVRRGQRADAGPHRRRAARGLLGSSSPAISTGLGRGTEGASPRRARLDQTGAPARGV